MSEKTIDPRFVNRERQPGLDLLRALAIVIVVIYHCGIFGFALPGQVHRFGWIGVDLFFVLSGYLIGGQLLAALALGRSINLGRFYLRRALRIMPAYFVVLAIYFCVPAGREFPNISPLWKFLLSVQNINLVGGTSFSHAWSLAIEDQFYLVLPLILILICCRPRAAVAVPLVVVLGGLVLRGLLARLVLANGGFQKFIYYPTWTRLDPLVFGVVLAAIERFRSSWWDRLTNSAPWLWLAALAAIVLGLAMGDNNLTVATSIWQFPFIAFGMAALLVCAVSPRLPFRRLEIPGVAFVASIAYSIYLSHKLVIHQALALCSARNLPPTSIQGLLLVEFMIYAGGAILFVAVERPFLQLRKRLTREIPVPARSSPTERLEAQSVMGISRPGKS